jgi:predicted ribosome quality control (RQC) complex YloA/Tae2 family protein
VIKNFKLFQESKKEKFPNLKKLEIDGYSVLIGKDAVSNDYLTTIMANPEDLWFHVKGAPGSHIIIRQKDRLISNEVKKQVSELAVKNSKVKVDCVVVCCKAKFVKKEPGSKPGQVVVDYKNSEFINISV